MRRAVGARQANVKRKAEGLVGEGDLGVQKDKWPTVGPISIPKHVLASGISQAHTLLGLLWALLTQPLP